MKKLFILTTVCITLISSSVFGTTSFENNNDTNTKLSHWSVAGNVGASIFDGDITQEYNAIFPKSDGQFALGVSGEYTFNPRWGMGIEYLYLPISGKDAVDDFSGTVHNPSIYLALNLSNFFYLERISKWNIYANVGIGVSYYNSTATSVRTPLPSNILGKVENGQATAIPFGINVEYNFSKHFAASWNTRYCLQNKDNFEAVKLVQGTTNDAIMSTTLGIRYKLNCKNREHAKNTSSTAPKLNPLVKRYIDEQIIQQIQIASVNYRLDSTQSVLDSVKSRLYDVENFFAREYDGPDSDNDGVPDSRDKDPNTPENTYVNYWGQPIPDDYLKDKKIESLYFEFDKFTLTPNASDVVREVALKMIKDPKKNIEIRGYSDNKGNQNYNLILSKKRSLTVKNTLVETYGIDPSRIIENGLGKIPNDDRDENTLSRRCDILFDR